MPKITKIEAFQVDLPLREGSYKWSGGNFVEVFDSTVVAVHTDAGITGYGEVCPLGPAYLPAYAKGARTGIAELALSLIHIYLDRWEQRWADTTFSQATAINRVMPRCRAAVMRAPV